MGFRKYYDIFALPLISLFFLIEDKYQFIEKKPKKHYHAYSGHCDEITSVSDFTQDIPYLTRKHDDYNIHCNYFGKKWLCITICSADTDVLFFFTWNQFSNPFEESRVVKQTALQVSHTSDGL